MKNIYTILCAILIGMASCVETPDIENEDSSTSFCQIDSFKYTEEEDDGYYKEENYKMSYDDHSNITSYNYNFKRIRNDNISEYSGVKLFDYDDQERIIKEYDLDNETYYSEYTYEDNEMIMISHEVWTEGNTTYDNMSRYIFVFNSQGNTTEVHRSEYYEDSWTETNVWYLTWSNGNLSKVESWDNYSPSSSININKTSFFELIKGTSKKARASKRQVLSNARSTEAELTKSSEIIFSYDDKINPYKDFPIAMNSFIGIINASNNNVIESTYNDLKGERDYSESYSYSYTEEGYPSFVEIITTGFLNNSDGTPTNQKYQTLEFTYICE